MKFKCLNANEILLIAALRIVKDEIFFKWANPASFSAYFRLFNTLQFKFKFKLKKA